MVHRASAIRHLGEALLECRLEPGSESRRQAATKEPQRERDRRAVPDAVICEPVARMKISTREGEPLLRCRDADLAREAGLENGDVGTAANEDGLNVAGQVAD